MKKILSLLVISLFFFIPVHAQVVEEEHIQNYDVLMKIKKNGDLFVSETIDYDFGNLERHGIYRDIPVVLKQKGKKIKREIFDIRVTDGSERPYNFTIKKIGENLQIKIGDPDVFITGNHLYKIDYSVKKPFIFFENFDKLSWNAIGSFWNVPIQKVRVEVQVDPSFVSSLQNIDCFFGTLGSTEECTNTENGMVYVFQNFEPFTGVTIDIDVAKGVILPPTQEEKIIAFIFFWWPVLLPLLVFIFLFHRWYTHGRDSEGKGTIITQFDAPDNLTPGEVGVIVDEYAHNKDVWATLIHLAVHGYITIQKQEKSGIFSSEDYILERKKGTEGLKNEFEILLMQSLFKREVLGVDMLDSVKLSDLKYKFSSDLTRIKNNLYTGLVKKNYFPQNPQTVKGIYIAIGAVGLTLTCIGLGFFISSDQVVLMVSLILSCAMFFIFSPFMSRRTPKGVEAKEHILGLKQYLIVAEKHRINFHNAPEKNPSTFEKYLPFAMVLGVEKEWAKQFQDLSLTNLSWYSSTSGTAMNSLIFVNSLSHFSTTANHTLSASHSSSGGGGSVGSGGGGGGGGSW